MIPDCRRESPNYGLKGLSLLSARLCLENWLPRLVESNAALEQALLLLRDLHFAGQTIAGDIVLKQVEDALDKAAKAKRF